MEGEVGNVQICIQISIVCVFDSCDSFFYSFADSYLLMLKDSLLIVATIVFNKYISLSIVSKSVRYDTDIDNCYNSFRYFLRSTDRGFNSIR